MTNDKIDERGKGADASQKAKKDAGMKSDPQWANGLKRIYDSVLEEPLPDSFKDLLSKLDDGATE